MPVFDVEVLGDAGAFFGELEEGFAVGVVEDFHIGPGDLSAPAGAEDFEDGFFGGEASCEVDVGGGLVAEAVELFGGGEAAVEEVVGVVEVEARDACDFDDIHTMSDDGHGEIVGRGRGGCKCGRWVWRREGLGVVERV